MKLGPAIIMCTRQGGQHGISGPREPAVLSTTELGGQDYIGSAAPHSLQWSGRAVPCKCYHLTLPLAHTRRVRPRRQRFHEPRSWARPQRTGQSRSVFNTGRLTNKFKQCGLRSAHCSDQGFRQHHNGEGRFFV